MTRAAIGTVGARVAIAAAQLLIAALAAQLLGMAEVGRMSLLVLAIAIVMLANNVIGGSALVYLEPRHGTRTLRIIAYAWILVVCAGAAWTLEPLGLVPEGLGAHAALIAVLEAAGTVHLTLLLGRERYAWYNGLMLARAMLVLAVFIVLLRVDGPSFEDYLHALYVAHGAVAVASATSLVKQPGSWSDPLAAFMAMLRQGVPAQAANGLQLLNYRLSYFMMQRFHGAAPLGLWSITSQLAESAWLAPKSLGTVLYARVSNTEEAIRQRELTLTVLKLSVALAAAACAVISILPDSVFILVFGPEAKGIQELVLLLSPGLLAMAASQALSHYLSGVGQVQHNTIGSGLALAVTVALGFALIPSCAAAGAAITASAAYLVALAYQLVLFNRISGARWRHYLPDARDLERASSLLRRLLGR